MTRYDVFNGDADGLCALQQLRLEQPAAAVAVTGPKRDIALLARVAAAAGDEITVLDVSLDRNRGDLERVLAAGARVRWFDHHHAGAVPVHPRLEAHIDTAPEMCTSLIVDRHLNGARRPWAIVGAFGDNLDAQAEALAAACGCSSDDIEALRELGRSLNYNAYGERIEDLAIAPAELHARMRGCDDPLVFARERIVQELHARRLDDLAQAQALAPMCEGEHLAVYRLPRAPWAQRVGGAFAHALAREHPNRAHAVLGENADGSLWASSRAPQSRPRGAGAVARAFASGGGREGAAGIDRLEPADMPAFIGALARAFRA